MDIGFSDQQLSLFELMVSTSQRLGMRSFVVGGVVRDLFLGRAPLDKDIDFLIEGNAIDFGRALLRSVGGELKTFPDFFTAKIVAPKEYPYIQELDLASARIETYSVPGALPDVSLGKIEDDLRRRDFSMNAMALPVSALCAAFHLKGEWLPYLRAQVLDEFGGLLDLETRRVQVLHPKSFIDDPTRIFRAARYLARLQGELGVETKVYLERAVEEGALGKISEHRKVNELRKVLRESCWFECVSLLERWGVLAQVEILGAEGRALWLACLSKLRSLELDPSLREDSALALAGALLQEVDFASFAKIGFSKRKIADLSYVREQLAANEAPETKQLEKLGDTPLLAAALASPHPAWEEERKRRKVSERPT